MRDPGDAFERPSVVRLEGSPWEMGLTHGRLLRGEIRSLIGQIDLLIFRRVDHFRGTGLRILTRGLAALLNIHFPERFRSELRGIARGSGVDYADLLLMNSLDDVLNILRRFAPRAPSLACSSFTLSGDRTRDGGVLHGRNLDYHFRGSPIDDGGAVARLLQGESRLFVYKPAGRAAFVSVGWPGIVGVSTSLNAEGISLGSHTSYLRGTTALGTPATMIYRRIAEEARDLAEVGYILRSSKRTIGNNLLVSSGKENRASLFEITMGEVECLSNEDGVLVTTNHFLSPKLAARQQPYLLPHSVMRWERLRELCDARAIGAAEAMGFLADVDCTSRGNGNPFSRIANEGTAVSVLFEPAEQAFWMGIAPEPPASGAAFRRFALDELFASAKPDSSPV